MDRWFARPSTDAETLRYARVLRADIVKWGQVVKASGASVD